MNRKTYRQIAKEYGISIAEVKGEMQAAINEAYKNPNTAALAVPRKAVVPTPDELITHAVEQVRGGCGVGGKRRSQRENSALAGQRVLVKHFSLPPPNPTDKNLRTPFQAYQQV